MKVIITGMHRSGTSMIAGLLELCGLYLGNNLLSGLSDNPKGHFEDREFLLLNRQLLRAGGSTWHQNLPFRLTAVPKPLLAKMKLFVSKWPADKVVGWKDPRACLTLPLWRQVIEPEPLRVVLIFRPYIEIAMSLKKRNRFTLEKGIWLCDYYCRTAEENVKDIPHIITYYHKYFSDWQSELARVAGFLGLSLPDNRAAIEKFIDASLWHHRERFNEYS